MPLLSLRTTTWLYSGTLHYLIRSRQYELSRLASSSTPLDKGVPHQELAMLHIETTIRNLYVLKFIGQKWKTLSK